MYSRSWLHTALSISLETNERFDTGLKFLNCCRSKLDFFRSGQSKASFMFYGMFPVCNERLIISCSVGAMTFKCSSRMMVGIGSSLHDLGAADLTNFIGSSNVSGLNLCNLLSVSILSSM